jgi:ABC-2 type transport system permease protein
VLALIPAVVLALAVVVRALTRSGTGYEIVDAVGYTLALPLVALLAASAVLGPEIDDGSIVYLIAKPVPRRAVALSKYAVAWAATLALGALPLLLGGLVLDPSAPGKAVAWGLGGAVAGTAYTALFLGLAALTRHAVVVGLLFVLLWEGLLGGLLSGIRWLAVGAWGKEVASAVSDAVSAPGTGLTYAVLAAALVTAGSLWFASDRLRSFTLRGDE